MVSVKSNLGRAVSAVGGRSRRHDEANGKVSKTVYFKLLSGNT